jgi:nicotinamidase-related amidase
MLLQQVPLVLLFILFDKVIPLSSTSLRSFGDTRTFASVTSLVGHKTTTKYSLLKTTTTTTSRMASASKHIANTVLKHSSMKNVGKLRPENTALIIIDIQERFRPLIYNSETVINTCRYMTSVADVLNIPILITEQYSKVFGSTIPDCFASKELYDKYTTSNSTFEKKLFSICTDEVQEKLHHLILNENKTSLLIVGIEAHVCVQQTCLDLLEKYSSTNDIDVHLICDGISSQQVYDRTIALDRMKQCGAYLTTAQSAAFMLMQSATHPNFKTISELTVDHMKLKNEFN